MAVDPPEKPFALVQTGFGLAAFGVALLLVPVASMALLLLDSALLEGLGLTLRSLLRNLALIAGVAGLGMVFLGLALTLTLRRDEPAHRPLRKPLELTFAFTVGSVMLVAGTAVLVRWFFDPDAARSAAMISAFGLLGGAILGLAAVWVWLGLLSRIALRLGRAKLRREARVMRGATLALGATILGVALAEALEAELPVSIALATAMYVISLAGGAWLAWRLAVLRRAIPGVAAKLAQEGKAVAGTSARES